MIGQQSSLGVSPAELLAAKNMASGKSDMNKEISLGGDLTRLMLAAMQLKKSQAELEKLKLTRGANPQTTVAQDVQKGIAQLQGQPEEQPEEQPQGQPQQMAQMDSGIGGLPAGAIDNEDAFAGGGIVAFAGPEGSGPVGSIERDPIDVAFDRMIYTESRGVHIDPKTGKMLTNKQSGAMGVAQFMPKTLKDPGFGVVPPRNDSKEEHLRAGKDYFKALVKESKGNIAEGAARYNWGTGFVDQAKTKAEAQTRANPGKIFNWMDTAPKETKDYVAFVAPQNTRVTEPVAPPNAAPGTDQQANPYAVGATAATATAGAAAAAALPPVRTGIASVPNVPAVFRSNRIPATAGVPPAGVPPAGVPPAGTPSLLSRGLGALRSPYTAGAGLLLGSREAGRGSDIVPGKPGGRLPTSREITELLESGRISDAEAREMLKRLPVAPVVPAASSAQSNNYEATINQDDLDAVEPVTKLGKQVDASKPKLFSDDKFLTDEIKSMIDVHKNRVPVTREAGLKQWKEERYAFGLNDELGKEQVDRLASLAGQAKQDRNVGLWMSAATGFFAMGAGKSRYALQNFAAGAGIGVEQANSALTAYSKRQTELNQSQFEIEKARRAEKRGDFESYQNHMQRAEEKGQTADDRYLRNLTTLFGIKQRGQEIKESSLNREESKNQRLDLLRRHLQLAAEKEFRDNMADYAKTSAGILDAFEATKTGPAAVAAKARITAKEKELRDGAYAATYSAAGLSNPSVRGGGQSKLDIDAERIMAGG